MADSHARIPVFVLVAISLIVPLFPHVAQSQLFFCPANPNPANIFGGEWHVDHLPAECTIKTLPGVGASNVGCDVTATHDRALLEDKIVWAELVIKKVDGTELLKCEAPDRVDYSEDHKTKPVSLPPNTVLICKIHATKTTNSNKAGGNQFGTMGCGAL